MLELYRHCECLCAKKTSVFILHSLKFSPLFRGKWLNDKVSHNHELWLNVCRPEKWENDEQRDKKIQREHVAEVTGAAVNLLLGWEKEIKQGHNHRSVCRCIFCVWFLSLCVHSHLQRMKRRKP